MSEETLTPEEGLARLQQMADEQRTGNYDEEQQHGDADDILCAVLRHLGHPDIANTFSGLSKRWWYA